MVWRTLPSSANGDYSEILSLLSLATRDLRNYSVNRLKQVTATKVRDDQKALRSFFNFFEAEGLSLDNPVKGLVLLKTKKVIHQAPEPEHVATLLRAWDGVDSRLKFRLSRQTHSA